MGDLNNMDHLDPLDHSPPMSGQGSLGFRTPSPAHLDLIHSGPPTPSLDRRTSVPLVSSPKTALLHYRNPVRAATVSHGLDSAGGLRHRGSFRSIDLRWAKVPKEKVWQHLHAVRMPKHVPQGAVIECENGKEARESRFRQPKTLPPLPGGPSGPRIVPLDQDLRITSSPTWCPQDGGDYKVFCCFPPLGIPETAGVV